MHLGSLLSERLENLIGRVQTEDHAREIALTCSLSLERARLLLDTYCNEARVGLALVAPSLQPGMRVLEVGSGIGLLASVVAEEIDFVGIEPGASGFGFMPTLAKIVTRVSLSNRPFAPLPIGVAELDPEKHGTYDFIYSVNVLEHVLSLDEAISALARVLVRGGSMVHLCPNYAVPYEPHLAIPLIPGFPQLTRHLFPSRVKLYPGLWEELSFVTAGRLQRLAGHHGLKVDFDQGVMGAMVRRILEDPILARRQGKVVSTAAKIIRKSGALALIDRIPARFATPMVSRMSKQ
jgi:SAM-dependent methyltransferase